jgi:rhodanese-related sulfurtransferase
MLLTRNRTAGIDPAAAAERLARGDAVALDVREPQEWAAGRIAGALHIPMGQLSHRAGELPRDRELIAVCRSGGRSARVAEALVRAGYRVVNLDGGMRAWQRAGLPLEPANGRVA